MRIPKYKTILYATDQGEMMRPVFRHALSLGRQYQASIIMLHVVEPLGTTGEWVLNAYLPQKERSGAGEKKIMKKALKKMKQRLEVFYADEMDDDDRQARRVSEILVVSGQPAEQILRQAKKHDADLIVVGTHTDGGLGSGLLGSTARKLTHQSDRPVLVVPVPQKS